VNETIVAQATPIGRGGVAIIRISGDNALNIAKQIFSGKSDIVSHQMVFGKVDTGQIEDNCLLVYFKAPQSYTGEDVVEIHCHGSQKIVECIVDSLIGKGCRLALNGEFTRRAVLNNKLDLVQAESINDLINSDTVENIKISNYCLSGRLSLEFDKIAKDILSVLGRVEAILDYPEDVEFDVQDIKLQLSQIADTVKTMASGYAQGRRQKYGVKVAVVGRPNVGKSSLVNALLGYDRSIVADTEGTTRDIVTDEYEYRGVKFLLSDTAGIRLTDDKTERQGIDRAFVQIENSDIVLCLDDSVDISRLTGITVIQVQNKIDLNPNLEIGKFGVSAKFGTNIQQLKQTLYDQSVQSPNKAINNFRHFDALSRASKLLDLAIQSLSDGATLDIVAADIRAAWNAVASITGANVTNQLLDEIFSKFCLGK